VRALASQRTPRKDGAAVAIAALLLSGCVGGREDSAGWTVEQAESITAIRGLSVRVASCRGLGQAESHGNVLRYARFACSAGARARGQPFDTVAVLYEVHVRDDSAHELQAVRFVGGPGIP
jgi:hypothetical protein